MCTMALVHSRVKEVVFIHPMQKSGGCGGHVLVPELPTINHRFRIWCWKSESLSLLGESIDDINIDNSLDV
jgi:tRNA-specific adenosine deaminase 3